jgi:REP element-mobilizing transposase RayT
MVLGYHFIFSAYGFWLPNDPRGSWSATIRNFDLLRFGPATKVTTTRSLANRPHDMNRRLAAKRALRYPPVRFTGEQARAIARGFSTAANERDYIIHALAILPDHAHLVMACNQRHIDRIAAHLKARATQRMSDDRIHPLAAHIGSNDRIPSPWARNYWCPFIRSIEQMYAAIDYVARNPIKSGLRPQHWSIVTPFDAT